ncbi:MAG: hypothetical protein ORN26_02090 [Candidatus Pacebacteria bacterium]|nr:hypothetical protein [Candidatus Paceibacterota bacterium]
MRAIILCNIIDINIVIADNIKAINKATAPVNPFTNPPKNGIILDNAINGPTIIINPIHIIKNPAALTTHVMN